MWPLCFLIFVHEEKKRNQLISNGSKYLRGRAMHFRKSCLKNVFSSFLAKVSINPCKNGTPKFWRTHDVLNFCTWNVIKVSASNCKANNGVRILKYRNLQRKFMTSENTSGVFKNSQSKFAGIKLPLTCTRDELVSVPSRSQEKCRVK